MKKIKLYVVLISTSILLGACGKNEPLPIVEPPAEVEKALEIEWATRMNFDKQIGNLANGVSYNDWFIYSGDFNEPPTIMAFNKDSGDKDWEYIHQGVVKDAIDVSYIYQNVYLGMTSNGLIGFDLDTKTNIWEINFIELDLTRGVSFTEYENKIFFRSVYNLNEFGQTTRFFELNPFTGELSVIYETSKGLINPPVFYVNENSNVNVIFNEYPWENETASESVQNLICIDLQNLTEVWRVDSLSQFFASNVGENAVIYDNRIVITGGDWHMYAFDIENGDLIWKTSISDDSPFAIFSETNHLLHDGKLYVNENGENVTCLNPETGAIIWNNPKGGANCADNMIYYEKENLLVFASWGYGSVMALDALTGETIHREHRYDNSSYNNDVIYDDERDIFFTATFKHVVGFTLQRPE